MAIKYPKDIFHSARLKLTLFYLGILLVFSLTLTISARALALKEYQDSDLTQRGAYRHLLLRAFPFDYPPPPSRLTDTGIATIQEQEEEQIGNRLSVDLIFINIGALIIGGFVSYWYAGRTLKPIEESHESQKRFAADASHELRTPLTSLRLEDEVFLRQKDFTTQEARDLIGSNLEEISRLENLAANLLSLAQFDNADLKLSKISAKHLVDAAVSSITKSATAKKITIKKEVEPGNISGQLESLTQLLSIVLDNAVKYSPDKSKVFVNGKRHSNHYVIKIRDQGPGIDEADLPHIFERLYRGDKARSSSGYGLGLSLAEEIATANNATIEASNPTDGGAEFVIVLERI